MSYDRNDLPIVESDFFFSFGSTFKNLHLHLTLCTNFQSIIENSNARVFAGKMNHIIAIN